MRLLRHREEQAQKSFKPEFFGSGRNERIGSGPKYDQSEKDLYDTHGPKRMGNKSYGPKHI